MLHHLSRLLQFLKYLTCSTKSPLQNFLFLQAMLPLLVQDYYPGSFKWLLQGDDTTVFFKATVKRLLQQYDHTIPYLVTDCQWTKTRPSSKIPTCVPCHHPSSDGCPCTPTRACCDLSLEQRCDILCMDLAWQWYGYSGCAWYWSEGLVQQLVTKRAEYESCAWSLQKHHGDFGQVGCLWELGYAPTVLLHSAGNQSNSIPEAFQTAQMGADELLHLVKEADKNMAGAARQVLNMASWHLQGLEGFHCQLEASAPCPAVPQAVHAIHAVHRFQTAKRGSVYLSLSVAAADEMYSFYGSMKAAHVLWLLVIGSTIAALAYVGSARR